MMFSIQPPAYNFIQALANRFRISEDLGIPKSGIIFQKIKDHRRKAEMAMAKKTLLAGNTGTKKHVDELIDAYHNSGRNEEFLKEYVHGLEEMMFMTHHKVRQPVANILGMAALIEQNVTSSEELKKIAEYMKRSALDLDAFTRELTTFIRNLEQKGKNKV